MYIVDSLSVSDPRVELWQVLPLLLVEEVEEGEGEGLTDTSTYIGYTRERQLWMDMHTQVHWTDRSDYFSSEHVARQ